MTSAPRSSEVGEKCALRLFPERLGQDADREDQQDDAGDGGAHPTHQREGGHDDTCDQHAQEDGEHAVREAHAQEPASHGAGPGARGWQGNRHEDRQTEVEYFSISAVLRRVRAKSHSKNLLPNRTFMQRLETGPSSNRINGTGSMLPSTA